MKLAGFGTLSDPRGNIQFASKFTLGERKQGLARIRCRIAGLDRIEVKHVVAHYAILEHEYLCKGAWYMSLFRITTTLKNDVFLTIFFVLPHM